MEQAQNTATQSNRMDWLIFLVSLVAMLALLMFEDRFFWIMLPFVFTFLVRGLRML